MAMAQQDDPLLQVSFVHLFGGGDAAGVARGHGTAARYHRSPKGQQVCHILLYTDIHTARRQVKNCY